MRFEGGIYASAVQNAETGFDEGLANVGIGGDAWTDNQSICE